ncbi:Threonine--tRNA ligase [Serratia liquefaciens]|uniref:threonine--tRNA ligase n=1 Tax=Serratia liquefaciens TaxID=614 RepID=UPI0021834257|nr:threonine--tRNA ligase [Serratia liquefaciens]CAI2538202.1 Threonine--tRNA ligase [Serratia liquefaciens]
MPKILSPEIQPVTFTLPNGSQIQSHTGTTLQAIAELISTSVAKNAVYAELNGVPVDIIETPNAGGKLNIITLFDKEALTPVRRSCLLLLGCVVKELFPSASLVQAAATDTGFYYDIAAEAPFTTDDLVLIENRMRQLINSDTHFFRTTVGRGAATDYFQQANEPYKCAQLDELKSDEHVTLGHFNTFADTVDGPLVPNIQFLKHFSLLHVSGAYWRGNADNIQLQRISGTAWASKKQLKEWLEKTAEAEKRDHRKIGRELDLFHFQENAPGSVFWHPRGWTLFQTLIAFMRKRHDTAGYSEVNTPDVMDRSLWEVSGHWENYRDHMFTTQTEDGRVFALKPMNCPGAVSLFKHGLKSYRDLPMRLSEFGKVHRYEPSGSLHGLLRVRHFTQDDAHIFCTPDQLENECINILKLVLDIYQQFGFENVLIKLSTRPEKRMGSEEDWNRLENALSYALQSQGLEWKVNPGEGAFYGPKLEFVLRDAIGRDWQCGTLQVDMNLPERFDISYIAEDGEAKRPVMLHRALFGSLERFTGILLEHYAGKLPAWLSPVQAVVMTISESQVAYANDVIRALSKKGIRCVADLRNEKIGYKIREQTLARVPYLVIAGEAEEKEGAVTVRDRSGASLGTLPLSDAENHLAQLCFPSEVTGV